MNGTGANVLIKFTGDTKDVDSKMAGLNKTMGSVTKGFVAGSLITKGLSTAFNMVTSSAGNAIKRIDTMNNFPKVMKNFGISADEAKKSVDRIDQSVRGLPTSLDQAVAGVQNIFMATRNLPEAEKMFQAINDSAMVFANGSTEAVDRFIYSYKQAMSAGKASAQDFNSMNDAIPGLMNKIADSMGITYGELKSGLSSGKISMDQFNAALHKLDTEGGAGMKSLQTAAKDATGGIQTAITNMKTAITRGVANAFKALDESLKSSGLGGISGVISNIGKGFESVLKAIVPMIPPIVKALSSVFNWLKKNEKLVKVLAIAIGGFIAVFKTISIVIGIINAIKTALMALKAIMIVVNAVMLANPIGIIIAAIAALIAIFVLLWNKCAWFRNFWIGLWNGIKATFMAVWNGLKAAFTAVINWVKTNWKSILLFLINPFAGAFKYLYEHSTKFRNFVNNFVTAVVNFFKSIPQKIKELPVKIWNILKAVVTKIITWRANLISKGTHAIKGLFNAIVNGVKKLPSKMLSIGVDIARGIGKGITNGVGWVKQKIRDLVGNVTSFIKKVFKIGSPSKLMADEIGQWLPKGIAVGIDANANSIYKAMSNVQRDMNKMVDTTFGLSPTVTGTASTHFSPNVFVTNNVDIKQDPLGQMVKDIKTFSGGAKNDYNYGMGVR